MNDARGMVTLRPLGTTMVTVFVPGETSTAVTRRRPTLGGVTVEVCAADDARSSVELVPPKARWLTAAGQADSASRQATSGTRKPSSAGRRSSAASETAGP